MKNLISNPSTTTAIFLLLSFATACADNDGGSGGASAGVSGIGGHIGQGGSIAGGAARGGHAGIGSTGAGGAGTGGVVAVGGASAAGAGHGIAAGMAGNATLGILPVNLGTAHDYVILAKSGISTVPTSAVTGNLGLSPAAASLITGFSTTADSTSVFSTSPQVTGKLYAANFAVPTPSNLTTAIGDMELAFTDAAGRAPNITELGAGNIGGMTLTPGVYKWGTGLLIPTTVALTGNATDVWIFQIAKNLTVSSATSVVLTGGAMSKNVFWQVSGQVELGTTAHFEGIVLTQTSITLGTGASISGRLLAQTAINIDNSTVVEPAQ